VPPGHDVGVSGETFVGRARREQLVSVTIDLVAEHGYEGCSLQRIADAAGLSKPAVVYHFRSKDAVVRAAHDQVLDVLVTHVGGAVAAAGSAAGAVEAYATEMVRHLVAHPSHIRMLVEGARLRTATREERWGPLAGLVRAARDAGDYRSDVDPRAIAVILGGAIDGVISELMSDPAFDTAPSVTTLRDLLGAFRARPGDGG
jgi:TetR/AcrR family transcriptional regulator